jgi:hypothetical protein
MVGHALKNFKRMMEDILWPFTNCFVVVYLDDIVIYSKNWAEHLHHIQQVLHTLRSHKLYANFEKCSFDMDMFQYLRNIFDENGVNLYPTKFQVIHDWPTSNTLTEL